MARKSNQRRFTEAFCNELRAMREQAGHSQVRMGEILGRSQRSVSYIEFGTTRLDLIQLMEWCEACGTDVVGFVRRMKQLAAEYRVGMPLQRKSS